MVNRVRGAAGGGRRLGLEGTPSFLVGEGEREDGRVGEDERVGAAGWGVTLMRTGPWNRKVLPSHSGSDSEARSSYCPRKMGGSIAY